MQEYNGLEEGKEGRARLVKNGSTVSGRFALELQLLVKQARVIMHSHQAALSYIPEKDYHQAVHSMSLSKRYDEFSDYDVVPTGEGLWGILCDSKTVVNLTQKDIENHFRFKNFSDLVDDNGTKHPPLVGLLAMPIIYDGIFLGILQVSDADTGEYSIRDELVIEQLADMISLSFYNYLKQKDITGQLEDIAHKLGAKN